MTVERFLLLAFVLVIGFTAIVALVVTGQIAYHWACDLRNRRIERRREQWIESLRAHVFDQVGDHP